MIKVENISKKYGANVVLQDISFEIRDGTFTALTGVSGKGKTTLLNIMGLLDRDYTGKMEVEGLQRFHAKDIRNMQRFYYAYIFQNYALIESETVEQNLKISLKFRKEQNPGSAMREALEFVGLGDIRKKRIFELSGGEQQRVAVARAVLKKPKYIFADEPTGNLDSENRDKIFQALKNMSKAGAAVIFATHDLELLQKADRVIELK